MDEVYQLYEDKDDLFTSYLVGFLNELSKVKVFLFDDWDHIFNEFNIIIIFLFDNDLFL